MTVPASRHIKYPSHIGATAVVGAAAEDRQPQMPRGAPRIRRQSLPRCDCRDTGETGEYRTWHQVRALVPRRRFVVAATAVL